MSSGRLVIAACIFALYTALGSANAEKISVLRSASENSTAPASDIIFIVSAAKATLASINTLQLANVTSTVQFNGAGARTGIISMPYFMNGTLGGRYVNLQGDWLGAPDAVLYGISATGQYKAVLLSLNAPSYDPTTDVLDFMVRVITPNATNPEAALKLSGGATSAVASERGGRNAAAALITAMEPNLALTDTALFIDSTEQALSPTSVTKSLSVGWGGFGAGCSGGGCYVSFGR
ncbi:hypothetical protein COCSUDRAFT_67652 [Coccomyxa subellipsoidea C-169]|uniref:Uncharacterized protein n=1 Tax=Coccomyxa subellipsoidea (strain C-169) TaxID=574566 RepID=I0YNJ6_COCSC|nr:hypothetical protein COCSUDRAFT_67652 [Coccomyxa subellipsoidea C-169]EIE19965.1 hypothetical protein COCSUDRAFT_67652 [Coccomyxa subellipsoidea C-169]|eukprot:XP_005644509.1 hypothetical protein COCSUDRAFT_67652 [Coccomyxa subellipsoidea C-169]